MEDGKARVVGKKRTRKTRGEWKKAFLATYRRTGIIGTSAEKAGVTRQGVDKARRTDKKFDAECLAAKEDAADFLETHALRRCMDAEKPSDLLTIFLLKGMRPHVYRENHRLEHTGPDGAPIVPASTMTGAVILLPREQFEEEAARYEQAGKEKAREP